MQLKFKFIAALIAGLVFAIPGLVSAQNPDLSQNPGVSQDQAPAPSMNAPSMDNNNNDDQDREMALPDEAPSSQGSMQQDQSDRPPMSELPPKPSPNIQGGPYGGNPNGPGYGNPGYGNPNSSPSNSGNLNDASSNGGVARISLIHGDVSTQRGDSGDWSAAQLNAPVVAGDKVSTGDKARTELQLDYANILRLAEHTQANITNLTRSQIQIQLGHGMANYTVLRSSDADAEIDTPNVSIRTERRDASFRILVTADDHTEVLVRHGEVEITTPQGGTRVGANQFITIRGNGDQTQYRIGEAPARDDWDQWNTDRDRMINNSVSRRHTNDYYVGSQDLDANGTWRNVPDYGPVWQPTNVGPDWAPYRAGRWVWEPGWGWTWVSYEPWGWAPYHYGRWLELDGSWAWWPGPVYGYPYYRPIWAPAYVSFFGFGGGFGFGLGWGWGSIGWFPVGPCDFFHPWWGGWGGRFGYTGWGGYNRGGFAPLHAGNRFSNFRSAMNDSHFRGASSVAGGEFGRAGGHFQPVNHAMMQNAHFATGNLPVVPSRESLSASGRPAAASTLSNRGASQHFFSPHGTSTAASGRSFEREQAQVSNAMRQSGVSPINGNRGGENRSGGAEPSRGFGQSGENSARSNVESRGNLGANTTARGGNVANSAAPRESAGSNNGGWQKFTPMTPRSSSQESAGRSSSNGSEGRGFESGRSSGSEGRGYSESRGMSESRGYSGYSGRPSLSMRQPIVTPRSYGGGPYGGRSMPGYGGSRSMPSYGSGRSAPSYGGGRSAPSSHGGGSSRGGGSHGGGGGRGGHR